MAGHKTPAKTLPSSRFEKQAERLGARRIAGIDEAGRGPLAGPVVAAAVVLRCPDCLPHLNDSKLLPADARFKLFDEILENASAVGVGIVPPETIDQINILQATRLAMSRAVMEISPLPDYLLSQRYNISRPFHTAAGHYQGRPSILFSGCRGNSCESDPRQDHGGTARAVSTIRLCSAQRLWDS